MSLAHSLGLPGAVSPSPGPCAPLKAHLETRILSARAPTSNLQKKTLSEEEHLHREVGEDMNIALGHAIKYHNHYS